MKSTYTFPLIIIAIFFFIFGFVTWLNSVLIPYLKIACQLETNLQAYLVTFAFYLSYFVMALPSAWLLNKIGFRGGMSVGLLVMAVGALVFIPAAQSRLYELFLVGLFVQGAGLALLQTAVNPYVAVLGSPESAAQRISIMGIFNKVAGILSPIILGAIVFEDMEQIEKKLQILKNQEKILFLDNLASKVILPYATMAFVLLILALMIRFAKLPKVEEENKELSETTEHQNIWAYPQLVLGVFALFLYVGVEVIAGDTIIGYGVFWGYSQEEAKFFTSLTLGGMLLGYILAIFTIPRYISQQKSLAISAALGLIFSLLILLTKGLLSVLFVALLGLANSVMWPAIFPLAITNLGKFTKTGSAMLIMAIVGGALLSTLYALLSDIPSVGLQNAYFLLIPSYLFIYYYATWGYKKIKW
ncbi:MAG: sugar MFS transporter [Thermonemataceae bacterium]|nr:sugar MFS transporter [Thermonemataceae bacterium]